MQINAVPITNESKLIADYRNNKASIMQFFDYHPYDSYSERVVELEQRDFKREALTTALHEMNQAWGASSETFEQIEQLNRPDSVVVIGGQQAGLVTGPLYAINKVISIIQLAREQQEKLQIPVIPVFWIAGEDHDYDEINHVYIPNELKLKKMKLKQHINEKTSVSHIQLDKAICEQWIQELFTYLPETAFTKDLYTITSKHLQQSNNFTDFFARLIFQLFADEGLVLVDSAHPSIRQIESNYFKQFIEKQPEISHGVANAEQLLGEMDYNISLGTNPKDAHLFYHKNNERFLLERTAEGNWQSKGDILLTTEELLEVARTKPENLSNNVVTRPVMQELLFPTLAFIGGPGEISYWAALQPVFHAFEMNMPPVVPRLSYTYVPPKVQIALDEAGLQAEHAIQHGVMEERQAFIKSKQKRPIDDLAATLKEQIDTIHLPIREAAADIRADVHQMAEKNLVYLQREIDFLTNRMNLALEEKYNMELKQFDLIQMYLRPEGGFQERTWNPLPIINVYGFDWIKQVTHHTVSFRDKHYVVYF